GVGEICKSVDISVLAGEIVEREPTVSVKGVPTEFHVCKAPVNDSAGQVTGIVGTATDVTQRKRTERALRESEKRYRALFDGSRDGIYVVSRDGAVLDANESFLNIFGYDREEMLQLNAINLYCDPADRRRFQDDIELTGSVKDYEIRMLRKDGTPIVCQATSAVRRDEAGRTIQYQGIVRDVTERKMVEEELQRVRADLERRVEERTAELKDANEHLRAEIARRTQAQELLKQNEAHCRALLSAVPDPVVVYDPTGKVTYVNDAFTETYGWTSEELLGKTIDFVPPGETEKTLNALERILGGEKVLLETTRFTKDGRLLHLHLVAAALRNADGKIS
ncbi:MAG: PAS domain S-box protein, partial [Deltaproteobacteria bacterium]|nr:PAS domain S-box protein [Deltaproteobacteria bacterium]